MIRIAKYPLYYVGNVIIYNNISILYEREIVIDLAENFFYPHFCVIYRSSNSTDANGDEVFGGLFYGICGFDFGGDGNTQLKGSFWQSSPTVIIPDTNVLFQNGDKVIITLDENRVIKASVKQFEIQKENNLSGTTIWLKEAEDELN